MRILTWNINGIRTLPQYHPWNTFKSFNGILDHLQADILCFQETKTSRSALQKSVAVPDSYHSFFSFPARKTGYSGVAVYTRDSVTPIKAEEGLSGIIQPKPPLSTAELVSERDVYPSSLDEGLDLNLNFTELDSEGRALIVDFGLFVLINVYCPNDGTGTEERDKFKMDYHRLLESRVKGFIEKEGREVIVVGDINACAAVIDHCEGPLMVARGQAAGMEGEEGFWEKPCRMWLRDWLIHEGEGGVDRGCLVDIVRQFWPNRPGMYTCWNTKIFARESNYGTRIDYILVTKGLVPWIKAADVQQSVKGSDHCPIFVDLHEEITNADGSTTRLRDVLGARAGEPLPRLATKYWDEFSGKQTQLHKFFVKKAPVQSPDPGADTSSTDNRSEPATVSESVSHGNSQASVATILATAELTDPPDNASSEATVPSQSHTSLPSLRGQPLATTSQAITPAAGTIHPQKRKLLSETPLERVKKQKGKKVQKKSGSNGLDGQTKLSSFYSKSKTVTHGSSCGADDFPIVSQAVGKETTASPFPTEIIDVDDIPEEILPSDDIGMEAAICNPSQPLSSQSSTCSFHFLPADDDPELIPANNGGNGKEAWSALLAPTPIPRCKVHNEPAKEFSVKKPGPNKGKRFFICSRPVGPGYDKGPAERLREEVDPQYRCNFFKWSSDVRKEKKRLGGES